MLFSDQLQTLFSVLIAFLIVTAAPGPANLGVSNVAMRHGRHQGIKYGTGLSLGLGFWGLVAATGMGAVMKSSEVMLLSLKIFGGAYLLWLAYKSAKAAMKGIDFGAWQSDRSGFLQGLMLNMANPKAVFAWMAALSVGLSAESGVQMVALATAMCITIGFINYALYAFVFSLPGFMTGYRRFNRWIEGTVAVLFAFASIGLFSSAMTI